MEVDEEAEDEQKVNLANAVDLSESEEEEELEDIIDDFALANDMEEVCAVKHSEPRNSQCILINLGYKYPTRTPLLLSIPKPIPNLRVKYSSTSRSCSR